MTLNVKWMGIDMGECLMDVTPRRGHLLTGDTTKLLGRPELGAARYHRWRVMIEKYGSLPVILERHKLELLSYVFDGDPAAGGTFLEVEQAYLRLAEGARRALGALRGQGIELAVVTAARTSPGPMDDSSEFRFLQKHKVLPYFESVISPRGKLRTADRTVDTRYEGTSKEDGTIYDLIAGDLGARGIPPGEAVMMGDKEWADIAPAKERGFKTILYAGYVRRGPTRADLVIERFGDLKKHVRYGGQVATAEKGWQRHEH
jgi:FMN phosphatase YigB (HAD superfamily)